MLTEMVLQKTAVRKCVCVCEFASCAYVSLGACVCTCVMCVYVIFIPYIGEHLSKLKKHLYSENVFREHFVSFPVNVNCVTEWSKNGRGSGRE